MSNTFYLEKDSSEIYEDFSQEDGYDNSDEERSSDRMDEMISKYGNY
jgi:hypothetical protein